MSTLTVTEFITRTFNATVATATKTSSNRATPQGGVFEGVIPTIYDTRNPTTLFIIQASIVIGLTRIIHWPLRWLRQPPVIAEVITGIVLGPSIMGRVPGFTQHIFPTASMPALSLAANIGLVLFLFLVGLEVDVRYLTGNWRIPLSVGALGMALPFGLGAGIAYGLYHQFRDDEGVAEVNFSTYLLFIGVAMAITAFPVLCRILTSLKMLSTPVGVIALSAGVGNDIVGWILLALCVALMNSRAGVAALWILLVSSGYCIFVAFPVRWSFLWLLRRTGSLTNGPTQAVVAITVMLTLASAFFTQIIGIHAIFGAFIIGLICPHGIFAIKLAEKIEDLVAVLLLPLYFALSGLNTNLGLLNSGIVWGYVVGVCALAFVGKIAGGTLAARLNGLVWRESFAVGVLMSCKGLVELIVLNIGLQARILSQRTFTIFVVMALVTTFATTPLVVWLYPQWYQTKLQLWKEGKIDWNGNALQHNGDSSEPFEADASQEANITRKILVYLRLDTLPSLFAITDLFGHKREEAVALEPSVTSADRKQGEQVNNTSVLKHSAATASVSAFTRPLRMHGLRLRELTERDSSIMRVSEIDEFTTRDPIIKAFSTLGRSRDLEISGQIAVVPEHSFSGTILSCANELHSDLILLPWSETGTMSEFGGLSDTFALSPLANAAFNTLAIEVYHKAQEICAIGVYLDHSVLSKSSADSRKPDSGRYRVILPFMGSEDDLYAVQLGLQLARNDAVELKILDLRSSSNFHLEPNADAHEKAPVSQSATTTTKDNVGSKFEHIQSSLALPLQSRVNFIDNRQSISIIESIVAAVVQPTPGVTIMLVGRNVAQHPGLSNPSSSGIPNGHGDPRVLGHLGTTLVSAGREKSLDTALLVVQCRRHDTEIATGADKSVTLAHLVEKASQFSQDS